MSHDLGILDITWKNSHYRPYTSIYRSWLGDVKNGDMTNDPCFNCPSFQPAVWWLDSLAAMCWNSWNDEIWKACRSDHRCIIWWVNTPNGREFESFAVLCFSLSRPKLLLREGGRACIYFAVVCFWLNHSSAKVCMTPAMLLVKGPVRWCSVLSIFKFLCCQIIWHWNILKQSLAICTPGCGWCMSSNY